MYLFEAIAQIQRMIADVRTYIQHCCAWLAQEIRAYQIEESPLVDPFNKNISIDVFARVQFECKIANCVVLERDVATFPSLCPAWQPDPLTISVCDRPKQRTDCGRKSR
jgi:hypothetical protein